MSGTTPPVPPLPDRPADEAARASVAPGAGDTTAGRTAPGTVGAPHPQPAPGAASRPAYDPAADPDDTGVPTTPTDDLGDVGRGFFRALFDISFRTFITRRLASVFYVLGLVAIAIGFIVYFVGGLLQGIAALWFNPGAGIALIVATILLVPILTFLAIILLRFVIEGLVALIAIAENTERTAEHTRRSGS